MTKRRRGRAGEQGYALVVAVIAMAMLAALSLTLIQSSRGTVAGVGAEFTRARLKAAADAGLILAVRQLTLTDHSRRWSIDGSSHLVRFDGVDLSIAVEDERGKIPLNQISEQQVGKMFEALGESGATLDALVDAFLDWRDVDDDPRPHGAEAAYYAPLGRTPHNGPLSSLDELLEIRGVTQAMLARLRPAATVFGGGGEGFDDRYAQPLALTVLGSGGPAVIERERQIAGERPSLPLNNADTLVGRALTIRVDARDASGGRFRTAEIVQLTGKRERPYLVRSFG